MIRVLVCGARDYPNFEKVWGVLDALAHALDYQMVIIEGQCPKGGADRYAEYWARANLPTDQHEPYPADWKRYKKGAGPIRNKQMLEQGKPDIVLAFGGLGGTGTNHMVSIAKEALGEDKVMEFDRDQ